MKQNKPIIIGLTGGIATGKSTVSKILIDKGYSLIDADKIAREVVDINEPAYLKIVDKFGLGILRDDKSIDRKALGRIIFKDEDARDSLNNIIHPYVFKTIKSEIINLSRDKPIIFVDIPLLFEEFQEFEKYNIVFDEIWLVYLEEEIQINRLIKRDGISKAEALRKIQSQMAIDNKRARASKIIDNSGDTKDLYIQLNKLLVELI